MTTAGANNPNRPAERILVGVDESESSIAALAWAVEHARLTGMPVHVVHAYCYVPYPYVEPQLVRETAEGEARQLVAEAVRRVVRAEDGVEVSTEVVSGHPARVLADLARTSRMVVIGGGGHGELAGLLLGSVGLHPRRQGAGAGRHRAQDPGPGSRTGAGAPPGSRRRLRPVRVPVTAWVSAPGLSPTNAPRSTGPRSLGGAAPARHRWNPHTTRGPRDVVGTEERRHAP